jgi:Glycosyltransferases involved in cell wall biogenesis
MSGKEISITIVIPAYNEEKRIRPTLINVADYLLRKNIVWEIIVVDDGSSDNTVAVVEGLSSSRPHMAVLRLDKNSGKGKAVREGMLKGKGSYLLFMDADSSTCIEELEKFLPFIEEGRDVIIGTRKKLGAEIIEHQSFLREFFGKGFTWFSNILTGVSVSDFTCGFKCFSEKAAKLIFQKAILNGWSFDAEVLFIARRSGYDIYEVPVKWKNDRSSKVRLMRDIVNSFKGLIRIKINAAKGLYED